MRRQLTSTLAVVAALLVAACSDDSGNIADSRSAPPTTEERQDATANGDAGAGASGEGAENGSDVSTEGCEDGPDRTVTSIDGVTIPETHDPEMVVEDETVAGVEVPGFTVPELHIPAQTVDAGCIIEYDAPGGCLGEVVVTGMELPERVLPGYEVPEVVAPDGEILDEGFEVEEIVVEAVTIDGVIIDEVCQVDPEDADSDIVWGVTRWGATRWGATQWGKTQWGKTRWGICPETGTCSDVINTPTRNMPTVAIPTEAVPTETLPTRILEGTDTQVLEDDEQTAYLAPADVLFEFDESDLTTEAIPTLEAIVESIGEDFDDEATISVEGHTDNQGAADYNQGLSEDRAEAVAAWLAEEGGIDAGSITTVGYGETRPAAPNDDDEGRAQNRRVVITVTAD